MALDIEKMQLDMKLEERRMARQTWMVVVSAASLVIGSFAAGATWWNDFGMH